MYIYLFDIFHMFVYHNLNSYKQVFFIIIIVVVVVPIYIASLTPATDQRCLIRNTVKSKIIKEKCMAANCLAIRLGEIMSF